MDKKQVAEFFDNLAEVWDIDMIKSQSKIDDILDKAEVTEGKYVLDVACGTGVLIPDYIKRKVSKCVAIDISDKMIEKAKGKFNGYKNVELLCGDAEAFDFKDEFDCIVIYNAFPHFVDRDKLFKNLLKCLRTDGRITVAHGMGRDALIRHHSGSAKNVSTVLPEIEEMVRLMSKYFDVDVSISTDDIYIASAKKLLKK
jgi:demethylmenaquinone methyltransferase/2-methoxy-6-polyprenyl-1,4-benzoquinol methylase